MTFAVEPANFLQGEEYPRAVAGLKSYFAHYTGRHFDHLAVRGDPDRFTERDFVAVSMLGVKVPPRVAASILFDPERRARLNGLLTSIGPSSIKIWDQQVDLGSNSPA